MRRKFIAGNWKMYKTNIEAVRTVRELKEKVESVDDTDIMIAPPYTALSLVSEIVKGSNISLGAQNTHHKEEGAYTGEISPPMLADAGCAYVIIGHSERREYFNCSDSDVREKLRAAVKFNLKPIVCIGEKLQERENGSAFELLSRQLSEGLKNLSPEEKADLTVAYEPVWAIGTGRTATPEIAEETHRHIRGRLAEMYGRDFSESVRILYGGSVKPENIKALMSEENIDGALVGGASLNAESFASIINF